MKRMKLILFACSVAVLTTTVKADVEIAPPPRLAVIDADNPWVSPGKVKWHNSFADARTAARTSGKPVLLFQMMGRLDQQFT